MRFYSILFFEVLTVMASSYPEALLGRKKPGFVNIGFISHDPAVEEGLVIEDAGRGIYKLTEMTKIRARLDGFLSIIFRLNTVVNVLELAIIVIVDLFKTQ